MPSMAALPIPEDTSGRNIPEDTPGRNMEGHRAWEALGGTAPAALSYLTTSGQIPMAPLGAHQDRPGYEALHPAPCTLHPAPCILHPASCTLHPTPYTLHPTTCTMCPTPRRRKNRYVLVPPWCCPQPPSRPPLPCCSTAVVPHIARPSDCLTVSSQTGDAVPMEGMADGTEMQGLRPGGYGGLITSGQGETGRVWQRQCASCAASSPLSFSLPLSIPPFRSVPLSLAHSLSLTHSLSHTRSLSKQAPPRCEAWHQTLAPESSKGSPKVNFP